MALRLLNMDATYLPHGATAPAADPENIRLGAFEPCSYVAGPGARAVVWVTGCLRRCPRCIKPDFLSFDAGSPVSIDEVFARILSARETYALTGVTFSGGEPFEQAGPLGRLCQRLHAAGFDLMSYSGYCWEALQADAAFEPLLSRLDLLIDGEYRTDVPGPLPWRGSANQRVLALSETGRRLLATTEVPLAESVRDVQITLGENRLRLSGFADPHTQKQLAAKLAARGIRMRQVPSEEVP